MPADALPPRDPRYHAGTATPHSIRFNDLLWQDFRARAEAAGYQPIEVLRHLVEAFVRDGLPKRRRKYDIAKELPPTPDPTARGEE